MREVVQLGAVTCPSGRLVVVDGGCLGGWSGARSPAEVEPAALGVDDEELAREVAGAVDFAVVGPDAAAAARAFGRQPGVTLYDVPMSAAGEMAAIFADHCREHGFDAGLVAREERVPHRERARHGAFAVFGVPVVAVGGLPADRVLRVEATRETADAPWRDITVRVADGPTGTSEPLGHVGVDSARLAFADADALSAWRHHASLDGRADVAFWGRARAEAVAEFGGVALPDGSHGWADLPLAPAIERYEAVVAWVGAAPERRLAVDFRPHSHHHEVMRRVRAAEHEAGTITVAGAEVLFAMTSWGDGRFPVYADRSPTGVLLGVRVTFP